MKKNNLNIKKIPKLRTPYLICAWPGMGEVAFKAAQFIVKSLKAQEFASIDESKFYYPAGIKIEDGVIKFNDLPFNKFYYHKNNGGGPDLVIFLSNAQPDLSKYKEYTKPIFDLAIKLKIKFIMSFASMPQGIDHIQEPSVWLAATDKTMLKNTVNNKLKELKEGRISGMNGMIMGLAKEKGIEGICLLVEIPLYTVNIANPKASIALVEASSKIFNIKFDMAELLRESKVIEAEINKIVDYLKVSIQPEPIDEEEIENLSNSLGEKTRLPDSIKNSIEKFFLIAKKDIAKAEDLKRLLDKWDIYKDYEDRFLDLFKRTENKDS
jgi:predicted ATP-grasp superfamily ATP-dependent carboligase